MKKRLLALALSLVMAASCVACGGGDKESKTSENTNAEEMDKKMADRVNDISDKAKELAESLSRKVTPKELAEETGIDLEDILEAVRLSGDKIEYIESDNSEN